MRVSITTEAGALAESPEDAFRALVAAAVCDGATREEFVESILKANGATHRSVGVKDRAPFQVIKEAITESDALFKATISRAQAEIVALLRESAKNADKSHYRTQVK